METPNRIANFLFEIGTMRKLLRSHRQLLMTDDMSDNIASHSYRVAVIGWLLAEQENVDSAKVVKMCLLHDMAEVRAGDQNYLHKKYIKVFEDEINKDQLEGLPIGNVMELAAEYEERTSPESIVAKDADLVDQILLLREYAHGGNREAQIWLDGKGEEGNVQIRNMKTKTARDVAQSILDTDPSDWWQNIWTEKNR